jgi:hypothetical protein
MSKWQSWVLTDVAADVWWDTLRIASDQWKEPFPAAWHIHKRTLHGGKRDGVDLIAVHNGGLSYAVIPTRGMGLWRGQYHGLELGWRAPIQGPVHPRNVNLLDRGGLGWLDGFDEWICRCGLHSNGPPGEDPAAKEFLPLHGRIANLPARYVEVQVHLEPPYELRLIGQVDEAVMFFSKLRLTTTITTTPGSNKVAIQDIVENRGTQPADLELLYHCQFGPPFLEAGSRIRAPIKVAAPRDARAAADMATFESYTAPATGAYAEQVYYYDLLADGNGQTLALLHNARQNHGVAVRMSKAELPRFVVWKHTAATEDGYVTGLEPATNYPNPKAVEREKGRVVRLPPKGKYTSSLTVEVHDKAAGVAEVLREIDAIQAAAPPVIHKEPVADFSG